MSKYFFQILFVSLFLLICITTDGVYSAEKPQDKKISNLALVDCSFPIARSSFNNSTERINKISEVTTTISAHTSYSSYSSKPNKSKVVQNYVDQEIFGKMQQDNVLPAPLTTDEEFIRRVSLDLTGHIPTAERLKKFLNDKSPNKRDHLINSLIGSPEFVDKWTMWLGDMVQNTAFRTNGIPSFPQGRNTYYQMIKEAVEKNTPYNQFVSSIINSKGNNFEVGGINHYVASITDMGPHQDTLDTLAVRTTKTFLGIETLDCLLCHDGQGHTNALNLWATQTKRIDAWGMSAFFSQTLIKPKMISQQPLLVSVDVSDTNLGAYELNTTTGNRVARQPINGQSFITPKYLFTGETPISGETYRQALARMLTKDRQFARATVNYLWAEFFGLGIVDPPTSFDLARLDANNPPPEPWTLQPSHPQLLEKLTDDFIASNYNLQYIMRLLVSSDAYQLSSRYNGEWKAEYTTYFARKLVRRLDAEEIHDAVVLATGRPVSYQITGFSNPIHWAMQLPDTSEPGPIYSANPSPPDTQTQLAFLFLNAFHRGDRDQVARNSEASIEQALSMMNNPFVLLRTLPNDPNSTLTRLLTTVQDDSVLVKELFLITLSRNPTKDELEYSLTILKPNRYEGASELMWALLNKVDFLYNY